MTVPKFSALKTSGRKITVITAYDYPFARLVDQGKLRVLVTGTFPLANAADAHRAIMTGHTSGKIALIP